MTKNILHVFGIFLLYNASYFIYRPLFKYFFCNYLLSVFTGSLGLYLIRLLYQ